MMLQPEQEERAGMCIRHTRPTKQEGILLTQEEIEQFLSDLRKKGRVKGTLEGYRRGLNQLYRMLPEPKRIGRGTLIRWREALRQSGYAVRTVNMFISVANSFLEYKGLREYQVVKQLESKESVKPELTRNEYLRLLQTARLLGQERVYLLVKLFATTGLTAQELSKVTVEAVLASQIEVCTSSGKQMVPLPACLQTELLSYAGREGRYIGPLFVTRNGTPLSRTNAATSIRQLCEEAKVPPEKGNPRCLRRLYLATREGIEQNIVQLVEQTYDRLLEAEQTIVGWGE